VQTQYYCYGWLSRRKSTCWWVVVCSNLAAKMVCDIVRKRNNIKFICTAKQAWKARRRLAILPVSKARTNKFYIYRQCTYIVYIYWPAALTKTNRENKNVKYNIIYLLTWYEGIAGLFRSHSTYGSKLKFSWSEYFNCHAFKFSDGYKYTMDWCSVYLTPQGLPKYIYLSPP
jgi:hypothetical protein